MQKQGCSGSEKMPHSRFNLGSRLSGGTVLMLLSVVILPLAAQSNHIATLLEGGTWHLHSRIPLGNDALLLRPSRLAVQILASAEVPEFEGWTLTEQRKGLVLLDASGRPVETLPTSITFRVTVGTREKFVDSHPMPLDCTKTLNDFLLDMHFQVQVFRGMQMRQMEPVRTWMIGVPADEASDERVYRSTFNLEGVRPDDRIVLLITDGSGARLSKFHLEFL
jgi:hypothetical protein